ncbi:hypothetical protein BJX96DRAFT_172157 [Aspergillus floccosus]
MSLICLALSLLALSSINSAYPIQGSNKPNAASRSLSPRSPNPRLMPATDSDSDSGHKYDDMRGDFFTNLLSALGLQELSNLNHLENWKDETQPADSKKNTDRDDKSSPTENTTTRAPDSVEHGKEDALRNPVKDPLGYASDILDLISGEIKEAIDSSDERTLN